jgi:hypothetical protein
MASTIKKSNVNFLITKHHKVKKQEKHGDPG